MTPLLPFGFLVAALLVQQAPSPALPETPSPDTLLFADRGVRMVVPVKLAGAGPYDFIVDTGAQRTVISRELASTLGLGAGRNVRLTAMTDTSSVPTVMIPALSVGKIGGAAIEAPALAQRDLGAAGILGIDTLQGHAVTIDFDTRTMAVTNARTRASHERAASDEIVVRAKSLFGQLVVTDATVAGRRVRVILDTGSVVTMGNEALRRQIDARNKSAIFARIQLVSVTGGVVAADYTALKSIKIGDLSISDLPIAYHDAAPFAAFGLADKPAILLGMDALKLFRRVDIDFANREVRLTLPRGMGRGG